MPQDERYEVCDECDGYNVVGSIKKTEFLENGMRRVWILYNCRECGAKFEDFVDE